MRPILFLADKYKNLHSIDFENCLQVYLLLLQSSLLLPENAKTRTLSLRKAVASSNMDKVTVDQARALVEATTFDIFNERDQTKRRQLMENYWASDITCYSPFGASAGYAAMDQLWDG